VRDALSALAAEHPGVVDRVLTEQGDVREHINVYIDSENVRFQQGLDTPMPEGSTLVILAAVSGG
jgi:molybdopterin converting factor small subunit